MTWGHQHKDAAQGMVDDLLEMQLLCFVSSFSACWCCCLFGHKNISCHTLTPWLVVPGTLGCSHKLTRLLQQTGKLWTVSSRGKAAVD
jgi:hypothetical protein